MLLKSLLQTGCNRHGIAGFNVVALHHVNQLSIAHQGNGRRSRRKACEMAAGRVGRFPVLSGKNRNHAVWADAALNCRAHAGTHSSRGASADGIHHYHQRAFLVDRIFNVCGGTRLCRFMQRTPSQSVDLAILLPNVSSLDWSCIAKPMSDILSLPVITADIGLSLPE